MASRSHRGLRRIGRGVVLASTVALVASGAGFAVATPAVPALPAAATGNGLPDIDRRFAGAEVAPSAAQLAALRALGDIEVGWTPLGVAHSLRSRDGRALTGPSKQDPDTVARGFLRSQAVLFRQQPGDISKLKLSMLDRDPRGATFLRYEQRHGARKVHGSSMLVVLDAQRRVLLAGGNLAPSLGPVTPPVVGADDAVAAVARSVNPSRAAGALKRHASRFDAVSSTTYHNSLALPGYPARPVEAELVTVPTATGGRTAWQVRAEVASNADYLTLVDAVTGDVIFRDNQVSSSEPHGLVHTGDDPESGPQVPDVPFSGIDGTWIQSDTTTGNNVSAYQDLNDDETYDAGDAPIAADQHFDYAFTDTWGNNAVLPTSGDDRDAVVTQLFYYTNWFHDYVYELGFTETARNFQSFNFMRGGAEGDPVHAHSDDSYGTGIEKWCSDSNGSAILCRNNANFHAGGADGNPARMQMYVGETDNGRRTQRSMNRDTVIHEYVHGVSGRIISNGNLAGSRQSKALGEGWSDALATSIHNDPVYGEYNNGNYTGGIRGVDYSDSDRTYGDLCQLHEFGCQEHADGTIWATVMWELREALIERHGYEAGKALHEQLIVLGMKATPDTPSFHDARNGYLIADQLMDVLNQPNAGNQCLLWRVFADNELGEVDVIDSDAESSPNVSRETPDQCNPIAVIGGDMATPEGAPLELDGSGSTANGDEGDTLSYAWDLDDDGDYDDSTAEKPDFVRVGQDGSFPISLRVTNSSGIAATADATITVTNAAPQLVVSHDGPKPEGSAVTVEAKLFDPGWEEELTLSVDWGDGTPVQTVDVEENLPPDATLSATLPHAFGDNGVYPVEICGSDDDVTVCKTLNVTVTNVAPTVTIDAAQLTDLKEGETLPVLAEFTDPGWLDTYTAEVDPGHASLPAGPGAVEITDEGPALDRGLVKADVSYGDDGTFTVTVAVTDDDSGTGSDTVDVVVTNVDPTATIDEAGSILVNGTPTFFGDIGETLPFGARVQDPGSDDETTAWSWDDGSGSSPQTSLVNAPFSDPLPSPTLQPRDFTTADMHAWAGACVYDVGLAAQDDDGGAGSDSVKVLITGTPAASRGAGFWQHQYKGNGQIGFTPAQLDCYLEIAGYLSNVFNEVRDASTRAKAHDDIFVAGLRGDMSQQLDRQLLTAWINFANGGVEYAELLDTDGNLLPDTSFVDVMAAAEAVRLDPAATSAQLQQQRDILTRVNERDGL